MSQSNGANGSKPNDSTNKIVTTDIYWLDEKGFCVTDEQEANKTLIIDLDEDDNIIRVTLLPTKKVTS
ncbi:hypothetical protein HA075_02085 [bacterium BFN5]|nr:hypothetical protein HA075_02000 [bacterium BFN5]QJW44734.1 hypothetical protein HA075_02085 [bacterium BFN5]